MKPNEFSTAPQANVQMFVKLTLEMVDNNSGCKKGRYGDGHSQYDGDYCMVRR